MTEKGQRVGQSGGEAALLSTLVRTAIIYGKTKISHLSDNEGSGNGTNEGIEPERQKKNEQGGSVARSENQDLRTEVASPRDLRHALGFVNQRRKERRSKDALLFWFPRGKYQMMPARPLHHTQHRYSAFSGTSAPGIPASLSN